MPNITIGRLRGGLCVRWVEDGKQRRYKLKARTRKEAEAEALDVYRRECSKIFQGRASTTAELWKEYAESLKGRPTGTTMKSTGKTILDHFGHYRPDQITRDLCDEYTLRRIESVSQGTVHTELGHLRSALNYAVKTGALSVAPQIWRPEKPAPKERFLDHAEIRTLIDAAVAPHIRLAIILLLGTAGRAGAILDLTWDRVSFEQGVINLRVDDDAPRKGRATVPMNAMTRAALAVAKEAAISDYVIEYGGGPVKSIRKGYYAACERANISGATIHTLRHTAAVHMAGAGVPMWKISQYLGHSNTQVTERVYARFAPSAMQDAADVLNFTEVQLQRKKVQ